MEFGLAQEQVLLMRSIGRYLKDNAAAAPPDRKKKYSARVDQRFLLASLLTFFSS